MGFWKKKPCPVCKGEPHAYFAANHPKPKAPFVSPPPKDSSEAELLDVLSKPKIFTHNGLKMQAMDLFGVPTIVIGFPPSIKLANMEAISNHINEAFPGVKVISFVGL